MKFGSKLLLIATFSLVCESLAGAAPVTKRPTLFIIGDSTVRNGTKGQMGWGEVIATNLDSAKIGVANRAIGGRSSRTFLTEGRWEKVLDELKPGDFLLIQFGHNDSGPLDDASRARGSIRGTGEETREIDNPLTHQKEVVHTYGWYLRKYVREAQSKGATPILCSPVPRNIWKNGRVARASGDYGKWAAEVSTAEHAGFIDLNELIARRYEALGEEKVKTLFFGDHTHTNPEGARLNAEEVVLGIKALSRCPLADAISQN